MNVIQYPVEWNYFNRQPNESECLLVINLMTFIYQALIQYIVEWTSFNSQPNESEFFTDDTSNDIHLSGSYSMHS